MTEKEAAFKKNKAEADKRARCVGETHKNKLKQASKEFHAFMAECMRR